MKLISPIQFHLQLPEQFIRRPKGIFFTRPPPRVHTTPPPAKYSTHSPTWPLHWRRSRLELKRPLFCHQFSYPAHFRHWLVSRSNPRSFFPLVCALSVGKMTLATPFSVSKKAATGKHSSRQKLPFRQKSHHQKESGPGCHQKKVTTDQLVKN